MLVPPRASARGGHHEHGVSETACSRLAAPLVFWGPGGLISPRGAARRRTLEKPSSHFSGQAREWGRTDSMQQGLPSQQSSERWPQGPRRSGSKNDGQMMSPTKRTSHDSTGSAAGVEEQMSLLEMFEEQKRQHLRQQMSGRGPTVTPRNSANEIGGPGQKGDSGSHHLAHIQSGVILQDGDE